MPCLVERAFVWLNKGSFDFSSKYMFLRLKRAYSASSRSFLFWKFVLMQVTYQVTFLFRVSFCLALVLFG